MYLRAVQVTAGNRVVLGWGTEQERPVVTFEIVRPEGVEDALPQPQPAPLPAPQPVVNEDVVTRLE